MNRWGGNVEPVSLLGNTSWATISAGVSVKLGQPGAPTTPPPTPPPTPVGDFANFQNQYNGLCLDVAGKLKADGSTVRIACGVLSVQRDFARYSRNLAHSVDSAAMSPQPVNSLALSPPCVLPEYISPPSTDSLTTIELVNPRLPHATRPRSYRWMCGRACQTRTSSSASTITLDAWWIRTRESV